MLGSCVPTPTLSPFLLELMFLELLCFFFRKYLCFSISFTYICAFLSLNGLRVEVLIIKPTKSITSRTHARTEEHHKIKKTLLINTAKKGHYIGSFIFHQCSLAVYTRFLSLCRRSCCIRQRWGRCCPAVARHQRSHHSIQHLLNETHTFKLSRLQRHRFLFFSVDPTYENFWTVW